MVDSDIKDVLAVLVKIVASSAIDGFAGGYAAGLRDGALEHPPEPCAGPFNEGYGVWVGADNEDAKLSFLNGEPPVASFKCSRHASGWAEGCHVFPNRHFITKILA